MISQFRCWLILRYSQISMQIEFDYPDKIKGSKQILDFFFNESTDYISWDQETKELFNQEIFESI